MLIGRTDPAGFVERAVYCPPALMEDDSEARFSVAAGERGATVGLQPSDQEELELPPGRMLVDTPAAGSAVDVVGFGTPVEATAFQRTPGGLGRPDAPRSPGPAGTSPRDPVRSATTSASWFTTRSPRSPS